MFAASSTVVHLHRRVPQEALERLNRLTGLKFSNWPESLVPELDNLAPVTDIRKCGVVRELIAH